MGDTLCSLKNPSDLSLSKHEAVKYTNRSFRDDNMYDQGIQGVEQIEVVSQGSKLMKHMKLPTVFIRLPKGELQKSKVYYVILQAESGRYRREIPAVMYSNPSSSWRTQTAELLPLFAELHEDNPKCAALTPMLRRGRYKRLFSRGCTFQVKAIASGRYVDCSETGPWNQWNVKHDAIRMLITEIIYQDLKDMPAEMTERVIESKPERPVLRKISSNSSMSSVSSSGSQKRNLSEHYPNLEFTGVTASGGSSFAKWFQYLPPDIYVDRNFKCDHGTTLGKDRFADSETLLRYLTVS